MQPKHDVARRFHFVRVADRERGTWSNPVIERETRDYGHEAALPPAAIILDLRGDARDWQLYELWEGNAAWWPLWRVSTRRTLTAMLLAAPDVHPAHISWQYCDQWEHVGGDALAWRDRLERIWAEAHLDLLAQERACARREVVFHIAHDAHMAAREGV